MVATPAVRTRYLNLWRLSLEFILANLSIGVIHLQCIKDNLIAFRSKSYPLRSCTSHGRETWPGEKSRSEKWTTQQELVIIKEDLSSKMANAGPRVLYKSPHLRRVPCDLRQGRTGKGRECHQSSQYRLLARQRAVGEIGSNKLSCRSAVDCVCGAKQAAGFPSVGSVPYFFSLWFISCLSILHSPLATAIDYRCEDRKKSWRVKSRHWCH